MRCYGHWGLGKGYGHFKGWYPPPEGYTYLGPCRCGFGPHAFWQEKVSGRIFRGFPGWQPGLRFDSRRDEVLQAELNRLKKEKEELEKMILDLEAELQRRKEKE